MLQAIDRISVAGVGGRIKAPQPLARVANVSVVVPCYNYGYCLRQCAESVLYEQPGIDVEVIIVDDKSTDDSLEVARALERSDPRVRVLAHETNRGHIQTYNDGLRLATGEFVLLLSADDLVTPGALTRAAAFLMAETSVGLVYGNVVEFSRDLPPARVGEAKWIVWKGADWLRARCRTGYNVVSTPAAVMRRSVLSAIGGYRCDLPHAGDFEMWLRTSCVSDIGFLAGVDQGYYRQHAVNMHKNMFHSGTANGQLVDLDERWRSFEAIFTGLGRALPECAELYGLARRTLACQALDYANYAYARGKRNFPVAQFEQIAREIYPGVDKTRAGRAFERRKRLGMTVLPLHPLWAPAAIAWRSGEALRTWRRKRVGV
ncbi:glycosyltransferase family 2 protein [Microvirga thermotolerans]|uniref:Glycosyltransferase n=1 Tax=Microvirga thermotolerans TaxID=2651334 RepID=A0A5P9JZJ7_9HYPH|nr:glycosyltransferase [Microvirga thermotolerans]QFU17873.1 glycosyltransferase [Microvirga thermotolerans]